MAEAVEDAFRYGKIILATTTYNGDVFPFMREFVNDLTERGYRNRKIGIMENGSWAPVVKNKITKAFELCKNLEFAETVVTIHSAVKEENLEQIKNLAKEMA
jgi:flavorubredoxin